MQPELAPPPERYRPPAPRELRRDVAVGAAVAIAALAPYLVLSAGKGLAGRDTARLYAPLRGLVVAALRSWSLPLWNPHEAAGRPLFAEGLHGVLHPISIAAAWLAPHAMDVLLLGYVAAAAAGTFLLARSLGRSLAASTLAAGAFALSGFVASMTGNLVFLAGAASLPWLVAALRACGTPGRGPVLAATAATAAALLAGDVQSAIVGALLGLALASEAGCWRAIARGTAGLTTGALVAAIQLAPTLAHLPRTVRSMGLDEGDRLRWALSPWRIVELWSPGLLGAEHGVLESPVFTALDPGSSLTIPFAESVHVGAAVLILAAWGLRSDRRSRILAVAGAVLLWLALGWHAGATQLLGSVPVWGSFRYTEKLVGPIALVLALLAAAGLDRVTDPAVRVRAWIPLAAGAAWALLVLSPGSVARAVAVAANPETGAAVRQILLRGLAFACPGAALAAVAAAGRVPAQARRWGVAAAVWIAAAAALPWAVHPAPSPCPGPGWLATLDGTPVRIGVPNYHQRARARPDAWEQSWCDQATMGRPSWNAAAGVDQMDGYTGLPTKRFEKVYGTFDDDERWPAFRRFSLSHLVVHPALSDRERAMLDRALERGTQVPSPPGSSFTTWAVPHRPWAFFAPKTSAAPRPDDTVERLRANVASGSDEVVLQADRPLPTAPGRVLSAGRAANALRIEAEAEGDAILVVNDAFWPGWEARVDGRPTPILAADVLSRAVAFPAGRHVVEMRYAPPELVWGGALTALGLAIAAAIALVRRPTRPPATDRLERPGGAG